MSLPNFHISSYYTFPFSARMTYPQDLLNKYRQSPESLDRYCDYYYYYYRTRRNTVNVTTHNNTYVRIFITYYTSTDRKCYTYYIIMTTTRIRLFFIRFFSFLQSNARASRINYPSSRTRAAARHTIRLRAVYNIIM